MTDAEGYSQRRRTGRADSARSDANHPLPPRPMALVHAEPEETSATEAKKTVSVTDEERDDAVAQLAAAIRTAERAHRAYLAEARLGDAEPTEHWSTWYAEYLLGLR